MRRLFLTTILLGLILMPAIARAEVSWIPIVPCGAAGQASCTPCHIFQSIKNLIDLVLYGVTGPIAAFMIVWAGGMMLLGGGKPALYSQGKTLLKDTLIGVTIILFAWIATNFLVKSLIRGGQGDSWYEFSCPAGLESSFKPIETALPSPQQLPALPAATVIEDSKAGVAALGGIDGSYVGSTFSACGRGMVCGGTCPRMDSILSGKSNRKLLEAIMYNESSCNPTPRQSGAGAYGLMQMKPETANRYRDGCDVTQTTTDSSGNETSQEVTITAAWLQNPLNADKIVCVANNIVDSLKGACGDNALNIAAGYNGGPGACEPSRDCADGLPSCVDGGQMRRWECPWDNRSHTLPNRGFIETRNYAPRVAACAK